MGDFSTQISCNSALTPVFKRGRAHDIATRHHSRGLPRGRLQHGQQEQRRGPGGRRRLWCLRQPDGRGGQARGEAAQVRARREPQDAGAHLFSNGPHAARQAACGRGEVRMIDVVMLMLT